MMRTALALGLIRAGVGVGSLTPAPGDFSERPYPQGRRFPLGLYSVHTPEEMAAVKAVGYNMGHRYGFGADLVGHSGEVARCSR